MKNELVKYYGFVFNHKHRVHTELLLRQNVVLLFVQVLAQFSEKMAGFLTAKKKKTYKQVGVTSITESFAQAINGSMIPLLSILSLQLDQQRLQIFFDRISFLSVMQTIKNVNF